MGEKKYKRIGWVVKVRKSKKHPFVLDCLSVAPSRKIAEQRFFIQIKAQSKLYWSEKHREWCVGDQFDRGLARCVPVYVEVLDAT